MGIGCIPLPQTTWIVGQRSGVAMPLHSEMVGERASDILLALWILLPTRCVIKSLFYFRHEAHSQHGQGMSHRTFFGYGAANAKVLSIFEN